MGASHPGTHSFEARLGDRPPVQATLDAVAGQGYVLELTVPAPSAAAEPAGGTSSSTPSDQTKSAEPARAGKSMLPVYIAGGVAVVGVSTGIVLSVMAGNTSDRIHSLQLQVGEGGCSGPTTPSACNELIDAAEERDTERNLSYLSFAVAGAAVVGGAVYFLWPSESASRASVGVSFLPGGTLVTVRGAL